jgi:DNA mismatch repair protein MutL
MTKIIELDETLANQIAAGEVIERPASVVKELVENAIDAGSTQITVSISDAGLNKIEITDNGEGIATDDVELALKRHATSKIKNRDDLFRIKTLGFRGEAMPSIASVSEMTIETATQNEATGTKLLVKGGKVISNEPYQKRQGTKITVADLFYNTPARLKYMKSLQAELSHITDVINRQSLAHPDIAFTLVNDGRELMRTTGNGDLKTAIAGVYGLATAKKMVAIKAEDMDFTVTGYVSLPELTRANRNYITILINGRYIKNFLINRAIIEGYGSKLMVGRFPLAVIDIHLDPYLADVNVHPTKQEVRISKERELMDLVTKAIRQALSEEVLIPKAMENLSSHRTGHSGNAPATPSTSPQVPTTVNNHQQIYYDKERGDFFATERPEVVQTPTTPPQVDINDLLQVTESKPEQVVLDLHEAASVVAETITEERLSHFPELEFLAQMHATYFLCQSPEGLFIVDQHAAQERVRYEEYREKVGHVSYDQQQLLAPLIFDLTQDDALMLTEKLDDLKAVGITLDVYGDSQFVMREHPVWMRANEIQETTQAFIDLVLEDKTASVKDFREDLAIMQACKSSIKANMYVDPEQARVLLKQLAQCENPYNCPHGRPAIVRFTDAELEKMFRRIQQDHKGGWSTVL